LLKRFCLHAPGKKQSTWVIQKQESDNLYVALFADKAFYRMRKETVQALPALIVMALTQMELLKRGFFPSQKKPEKLITSSTQSA